MFSPDSRVNSFHAIPNRTLSAAHTVVVEDFDIMTWSRSTKKSRKGLVKRVALTRPRGMQQSNCIQDHGALNRI